MEGAAVAYVINEPCIGAKDASCVDVCPVDCIHPTPDEADWTEHEQLYIDPAECIDCDACVEACPVDAITPEDMVPPEWQGFIKVNADYYAARGR
jgi:NAD-dependent dihydropyrimidine dehydrogenase PreA subunit